jgi:DUF3096 family protein
LNHRGVGGVSGQREVAHAKRGLAQRERRIKNMNIHLSAGPLVSLLAGILILVMPKLLNYIVAIYLIVIGLIGLFGVGALHMT